MLEGGWHSVQALTEKKTRHYDLIAVVVTKIGNCSKSRMDNSC
jgi:hypothetical protein